MVAAVGRPGHQVTGTLVVLACAPALCPHAQFALAEVLGRRADLRWSPQPALPGSVTSRCEWQGPAGTAGRLASTLRRLTTARFEVTEQAGPGTDGERYSYAPGLGLHRADLSANGDIVVREGQLLSLLAAAATAAGAVRGGEPTVQHGLRALLGLDWDDELEPLRRGGDGIPVTTLRRTG
ncbi:MAG: hypothetical protein JWM48_3006 [Mycobacterium sp.]|nr:hypothetical protein [Mycobacterium sp.]MCW2746456.1 hypothetical protein [Mycobacterium sp.]